MATVYSINYTDPNKPGFIINPKQVDGTSGSTSNSSLILHGTGRLKYGEALNENFLHLLENFASPERVMPLASPIQSANNTGGLGTNFMVILGDVVNDFNPDFSFIVDSSTGAVNDGTYTVVSTSFNQPTNETTVIINELFPDVGASNLGTVKYTVIQPDPVMVNPPYHEGQLWFNKTNQVLYIFQDISDTATQYFQWAKAKGETTIISPTPPPPSESDENDLWYDPVEEQLKILVDGLWISVADRYVLKAGDTISVNDNSVGAIGNPAGVLTFTKDDGISPSLYINEGHGDISKAPDFRSTDAILITASETVHIIADSINNGTGGFVVGKGANDLVSSTDLFHVLNDGTIQSGFVTGYENLVITDGVLTNKKYVDDEISTLALLIGGIGGSLADYVLKAGDTMPATSVFQFGSGLFINEGGGDSNAVGADIRGSGQLLFSSSNNVTALIDNDNSNVGEFKVMKGTLVSDTATPMFRVQNDGTIHSDIISYENLINNDNDIPNKKYVDDHVTSVVNTITPIEPGSVFNIGGSTFPSGYFECNGAAISRTTYADLFARIGTTSGSGNGSTTFNIPDLRGEFVRGWDHGRGVDSGRSVGSYQADELRSHRHTQHNLFAPAPGVDAGFGARDNTSNTGYTGGAETRPRNRALMYIIKY